MFARLSMPPEHARVPLQRASQRPPAQRKAPGQLSVPEHVRSHLPAWEQLIVPAQARSPLQFTVQLVAPLQSMPPKQASTEQ
jgi:hypothetical protein